MVVNTHSFLDELSPAIIAELRQLEEDYGIQLASVQEGFMPRITRNQRNYFMGDPLDPGMLRTFIPIFLKEWQLYPRSMIHKMKLKRILLCQDLTVNFTPQGAAPDVESKTLFFNLNPRFGIHSPEQLERFFREAIHHELFHYLDYQLDLDIQNDTVWSMLNPKWFSYGGLDRRNRYDSAATQVTNIYPGFISRYSLINTAEDKAEIFSRMMVNMHEMECRGNDDLILGKKIDRMKQIVKGYCPEMDDQFWEKIRYLDRPRLTLKGKEDPWAHAHPTLPALPRLVEPVVVVYETICEVPVRRTLVCHRCRRCCR